MAPGKKKGRASATKRRQRFVAGFPAARPEDLGWSRAPLEALRAATRREVNELGSLPNAAHMVIHRGRCVFTHCAGWADRARRSRFGLNTICKIHGSAKPLVVAAFMTLVEEGRVKLSDPISKYMRFADTVEGLRGRLTKLPTIYHLLTMTAGLGYSDSEEYKDVMAKVASRKIKNLRQLHEALAARPLLAAPGSRYHYSFCTDLVGHLIEVVSGIELETFVRRRILLPLGMKDTYFVVPAKKRSRTAVLYECKAREDQPVKRRRGELPYQTKKWYSPDSAPGIKSAGGGITSYNDAGMWSTVRDYARFCHMLLSGGVSPTGRRVLREATVRTFWKDGLAPFERTKHRRVDGWNDQGTYSYWDRVAWTPLNVHACYEKTARKSKGSRTPSVLFMGGGGGAYWVIDRRRDFIAMSFTQAFGGRPSTDGADGHGPRANDAAPFARAAADHARVLVAHEYGQYGVPGCSLGAAEVLLDLYSTKVVRRRHT